MQRNRLTNFKIEISDYSHTQNTIIVLLMYILISYITDVKVINRRKFHIFVPIFTCVQIFTLQNMNIIKCEYQINLLSIIVEVTRT